MRRSGAGVAGRATVAALVVLGVVLGAGCSSQAPGTRPDDMSAAAHEAVAEEHAGAAAEHAAKYDPAASATREVPVRGGNRSSAEAPGLTLERSYNPTARHRDDAAEHREHARQHEAAARELERFEAAECAGVAPAARGVCPLAGAVGREALQDGLRVQLPPGTNRDAVLAAARCHLAFARTRAHEGMPGCPLHLPEVRAGPGPSADLLDLTGGDAKTAAALRRLAVDETP